MAVVQNSEASDSTARVVVQNAYKVYKQQGMTGLQKFSGVFHDALKKFKTFDLLEKCAMIDQFGGILDYAVSKSNGSPRTPYFSGDNVANRLIPWFKAMNVSDDMYHTWAKEVTKEMKLLK